MVQILEQFRDLWCWPGVRIRRGVAALILDLAYPSVARPLLELVDKVKSGAMNWKDAQRMAASDWMADVLPEGALDLIEVQLLRDVATGDQGQQLPMAELYAIASEANGSWLKRLVAWGLIGRIQSNLCQQQEARVAYGKALQAARRLGNQFQEAIVWKHLGEAAHRAGSFKQAASDYQQSLQCAGNVGDIELVAYCRLGLGGIALAEGDICGVRLQSQLLEDRLRDEASADCSAQWFCLADSHSSVGDVRRQIACLEIARSLIRPTSSSDLVRAIKTKRYEAFRQAGRRATARKALAELSGIDTKSTKMAPLPTLAVVVGGWHLRLSLEALRSHVEQLRHERTYDGRMTLVQSLQELAGVLDRLGHTNERDKVLDEAYTVAESLASEQVFSVILLRANYALEHDELDAANSILQSFVVTPNLFPVMSQMLHGLRGELQRKQRNYDEAEHEFSLALQFAEKHQFRYMEMSWRHSLAQVAFEVDRAEAALELLRLATREACRLGQMEQLAVQLQLAAKVLLKRAGRRGQRTNAGGDDVVLAWRLARRAARCIREMGKVSEEREILGDLAHVEETLSELDTNAMSATTQRILRRWTKPDQAWMERALETYQQAIDCHDLLVTGSPDISGKAGGTTYRVRLQESGGKLFERAANAALKNGANELAMELVEKRKCALLTEQILNVPQALVLPKQLTDLRGLQNLDPAEAVISYGHVESPDGEQLVVFLRHTSTTRAFACDKRQVLSAFGQWQALLRESLPLLQSGAWGGVENRLKAVLSRLHACLFPADLQAALRNCDHGPIQRLIVIPFGDLHAVPFAALISPETGTHLIDDMEVVVVPNAVIWSDCRQRRMSRSRSSPRRASEFLGVTNPSQDSAHGLASLTSAEEWLGRIAGLFQRPLEVLRGSEATASNFLARSQTADIIQVTVHGQKNSAATNRPALFFAPEIGPGETSRDTLTDRDLIEAEPWGQLFERCELFVMNACDVLQLGFEQQVRTGEVDGLPAALMVQGVPTIVGCLWMMRLDVSQLFFTEFYRRLINDEQPIGRAFRESILWLRQQQLGHQTSCDHPLLWASLALMGDIGESPCVS